MDLDRLHAVIVHPSGRRCGQTFAMLVEAIQQADFGIESVTILAETRPRALMLLPAAEKIAREMGYHTTYRARDTLLVNDMRLQVQSKSQKLLGRHDQIFVDHHTAERTVE